MDPEAKLEELRTLAAEILTLQEAFGETEDAVRALERISEKADELAQGFQHLDDWLKKGGFLPTPWKRQSSVLGLIEEKRRLFPNLASHLDDIESALQESTAQEVEKLQDELRKERAYSSSFMPDFAAAFDAEDKSKV